MVKAYETAEMSKTLFRGVDNSQHVMRPAVSSCLLVTPHVRTFRSIRFLASFALALLSAICSADNSTHRASAIEQIILASEYDIHLFENFKLLKSEFEYKSITEAAKLKGVRLMAASMLDVPSCEQIATKEVDFYKPVKTDEKLTIGEFQLGMNIETTFAVILARYSFVKPRLYLDGEVLCIADENGQDLAWANAQSREVHWLTLTPAIVRRIVGFNAGSFADLERAVEKKLSVSFTTDTISNCEVHQQIRTLDTVDGETLRYFSGSLCGGENVRRSIRKTINQYSIDYHPISGGGVCAMIVNGFEDAMQKDENVKNARSSRFAPRGSLQLQLTKNAMQGDWNSTGGYRNSSSGLQSMSSGLEGAVNQINNMSL